MLHRSRPTLFAAVPPGSVRKPVVGRLGGGKAAEIILSLPEKLSISANRAAKPQECSTTNPAAFLQFNGYEILRDAGGVSHEAAFELAETEYEKFRVSQDRESESDLDREVKKLKGKK